MDEVEKKALMIAPSYDALPKEFLLSATLKDLEAMKKVIIEKFGFKEDNIKVLKENEAIKENILRELRELATSSKPGSVVFLYYSGHGSYMEDSQDEGLFPTIPEWPRKVPMQELCITGQDLFPFFEELSKKSVYLTVIFDCCHSGYLYLETNELEGLTIKQFVPERKQTSESTETLSTKCAVTEPKETSEPIETLSKKCAVTASKHKKYTKADRGGWTPEDKDYFFYFAACTADQKAIESRQGSLMTLAIVNTLEKLQAPNLVTYEAFFRLLNKEFKIMKNKRPELEKVVQTPQLEAVNSNTVLFGVSQVQSQGGGIVISNVISPDNNPMIVLDSGYLQNLRAGKYFVYEATASEDSVSLKETSPDYLGVIDVNEGQIDDAQAIGSVSNLRDDNRKITAGCLAYLESAETINHSVWVCSGPESVDEKTRESLIKELKGTDMLNVFTEPEQRLKDDPDLITITCETIKGKQSWVARQGNRIHVPPISVGRENIMAKNLCRYIRYHEILERANSPDDDEQLLKNVTLKVFKVEKLPKYNKRAEAGVIAKELEKAPVDITKVNDRRVYFKAHQAQGRGIVSGTGDSCMYQVINDNDVPVHICIVLYQCDGQIRVIYPKNKNGATLQLRGRGESAEGITPLFIPEGCLRTMAEPDPEKQEPDISLDTLVLYASSKPANWGAILQSAIEVDSDLVSKDTDQSHSNPLSSLEKFLNLRKKPAPEDDDDDVMMYMIEKVPIYTLKYISV